MEGKEKERKRDPIAPTPEETAGEAAIVALNAIPVVGGSMAAIAENIIRERQNRRLSDFLKELAGDLHRLRDLVNEEFMRSEQAKDLFEDIVSKAAETRQQAKLNAFRALFLNTVLSERPSYNEAAEVATLIDSWQERHILMLRILADPVRADREMGRPVGEGGGSMTSINQIFGRLLPDWDDDQIARTWQDLFDRQIHRTPSVVAMMTDSGIHQLENRLTSFGQNVTRYLTAPD